jgi:hypothetical protein
MQRALFVACRTITDLLRHNKIWLPVVVVHAGMGTGLRVVRLGCCYGTQTVKEDSRTTLRSLVAQLVPCWTRTLPYGRWQSGESRQGHTPIRFRSTANAVMLPNCSSSRVASAVNTPTKPRLMARLRQLRNGNTRHRAVRRSRNRSSISGRFATKSTFLGHRPLMAAARDRTRQRKPGPFWTMHAIARHQQDELLLTGAHHPPRSRAFSLLSRLEALSF